jgi:hypothetical protein
MIRIIFVCFLVIKYVSSRDVIVNSADYNPKESDLIDYGTLKFLKNRKMKQYIMTGNFTLNSDIGNEKLLVMEVYNERQIRLLRVQFPFCEYMRNDQTFWPKLVKSSDFPDSNPCPFPAVIIRKIYSEFM